MPVWKNKIEKEINEMRGKVAILVELLRRAKVKSRIIKQRKNML